MSFRLFFDFSHHSANDQRVGVPLLVLRLGHDVHQLLELGQVLEVPAHVRGQHHVDHHLAHLGELLAGHFGENVDARLGQSQLEGKCHLDKKGEGKEEKGMK